MAVRLACALAIALGVAAPSRAGDPTPPFTDPLLASWVPAGPVTSVTPIVQGYMAPGLMTSAATQALAGVSDWSNTDVWPVQVPTGINPGRYIEVGLLAGNDRAVRVTRVRYAAQSYGTSITTLSLATSADGFAALLGSATNNGTEPRAYELEILPIAPIEFAQGQVRGLRLFPYQVTPILEWVDLVGPNGGLRIDGRIALVRNVAIGQDRYSFTTDTLGGVELPAAITHVQFAVAGGAVVLLPFAATAPRTACLAGIALLDIAGAVDPATITGTTAPCGGPIDPNTGPTTTLWKLAGGEIYGLQVTQVAATPTFRVRRLDDGVFANSFE